MKEFHGIKLCDPDHKAMQALEAQLGYVPSFLSHEEYLEKNDGEYIPSDGWHAVDGKVNYLILGDDQNLSELPPEIFGFTALEKLTLFSLPLTSIPDEIANLSSLQELFIEECEISSLPETIEALKLLKILNLYSNKLKTLPEAIGALSSLRHLNLFFNQLTSLPNSIGNLTSLKILDLSDNQLTSLPNSITDLQSLEWLDLSNNQLSHFLEEKGSIFFLNLKSLDHLDLFDNGSDDKAHKILKAYEKKYKRDVF